MRIGAEIVETARNGAHSSTNGRGVPNPKSEIRNPKLPGPKSEIRNPKLVRLLWLVAVVLAGGAGVARAERIKDIVEIKGVRGNPLWGYGLVVGLRGTGDDSPASRRALANILRRGGLTLSPADLKSKSIASVLVTAELPAFARAGSTIDVRVSAIGDAASLEGGTLQMTPLQGADAQVYAVAQGALVLGGFVASGQSSSITKNHPTVARIPAGANVEREELSEFVEDGCIVYQLRYPDFTTVQRLAAAINAVYPASASAEDAGTVKFKLPAKTRKDEIIGVIDRIGALQVEVDQPALVVINERTGTVVVGENVSISMVAISHGNLSIVTQEKDYVSQPLPFSDTGTTEKTHRTDIKVVEDRGGPGGPLQVIPRKVTVAELARALNAMGLTPRDLISIFEALREAGALQAQIKVM